MPELIAKTALDGRSVTRGALRLAEVDLGPVTSVALFAGAAAAEVAGMRFPAPNTVEQRADGARLVWTGRDQAFLLGAEAPEVPGAALTDQSGGWCCLALSGPQAAEVLMRLIALDLRPGQFPVGRAVRCGLNHMNAVVIRTGEDDFEVLVFRSMARTAWHEIEAAMNAVIARG